MKFEVPASAPWPSSLHGLRLGKRLELILSSPEFFDRHPDKVKELSRIGFNPSTSSLSDDWDVIIRSMRTYKELNGNLRVWNNTFFLHLVAYVQLLKDKLQVCRSRWRTVAPSGEKYQPEAWYSSCRHSQCWPLHQAPSTAQGRIGRHGFRMALAREYASSAGGHRELPASLRCTCLLQREHKPFIASSFQLRRPYHFWRRLWLIKVITCPHISISEDFLIRYFIGKVLSGRRNCRICNWEPL